MVLRSAGSPPGGLALRAGQQTRWQACAVHWRPALPLRSWPQVDLAPEHVTKHTLSTLGAILKHPTIRKRPFMVCGSRAGSRGACALPRNATVLRNARGAGCPKSDPSPLCLCMPGCCCRAANGMSLPGIKAGFR